MPRGRFISKSFYDNNRLNEMSIETHHLFGGINIVCADRDGRCKGDAKWVNSQVYSLRDYSDKQVEDWLTRLQDAKDDDTGLGLIERYNINGRKYIWIPGFEKHQKGRNKGREAGSEIPPCPKETMPLSGFSITHITPDKRTIKELRVDSKIEDDLKVASMIKYYEENIGQILTPNDLEKLKDFADTYPDGWFEQAVDEANAHNAKTPQRYIEKILETRLKKEPQVEPSSNDQGFSEE